MTRMAPTTQEYPAPLARFPRRAAGVGLPLVSLVAAGAAALGEFRWAAMYWLASAWALVFFVLTPLVFRAMLFERKPLAGLGWLAVKLGWLALMAIGCWRLDLAPEAGRSLGCALLASTVTTLLVVAIAVVTTASAAVGLRPMIRHKGDAS